MKFNTDMLLVCLFHISIFFFIGFCNFFMNRQRKYMYKIWKYKDTFDFVLQNIKYSIIIVNKRYKLYFLYYNNYVASKRAAGVDTKSKAWKAWQPWKTFCNNNHIYCLIQNVQVHVGDWDGQLPSTGNYLASRAILP